MDDVQNNADRRARTASYVALGLLAIGLGLHAFYVRDAAFIADEPDLLRLALSSNQAGRLADHGLLGSFGVRYPPACTWFYQLLLALTLDVAAVATLKTAIVSLALLLALWRLHALTRLSPWPLLLIALSPFIAFYQRLLWDNVFLIPVSAWMVVATASFLVSPSMRRCLVLLGLCVVALQIHLLAVVPIATCVATALIFRGAWMRQHLGKVTLGVVAAAALSSRFLYEVVFERGVGTHPHPSLTESLVGVVKGWSFCSHGGFDFFMPSFYLDSALLHGLELASGWLAMAAGAAALGALVIQAARRATPLAQWRLADQLACLAALMVVGQLALLVTLQLDPFWHYFNGVWLGYFYLVWWGFDRVRTRWWSRALLLVQTVTVGVMTMLLGLHVHAHHGNRTEHYGATLGNQMDVASQLVGHSVSGVTIAVDNYKKYPYALETLVYIRALQTGTRMSTGTDPATVRYAEPSGDDGKIAVVFGDGASR